MVMSRIRAVLRRELARAGWAGVLGAGAAVFAAALHLSGNRPLIGQLERLAADRREIERRIAQPDGRQASPRERLDAFYARFPAEERLPEVLLRGQESAKAHGIALVRAEYKSTHETGTPLARVDITVPARGPYRALRAWLAELLAAMPELALVGIDLKRNAIGDDQLDAQIRLAVFLRAAS
jgi:hypothetical protein